MTPFKKFYSEFLVRRNSDKFYKDFFVLNPSWNGKHPNEDETVRLTTIKELISMADLRETSKVLDAGCGRGWFTNILSSEYNYVVGIDPVKSVIKYAKKLYPDILFYALTPPQFQKKFPNCKFDLIVTSEVIEHVSDKLKFIQDVSELIDRNGFFIISTPRGELRNAWESKFGKPIQPKEEWIASEELVKLITQANFEIVARKTCGDMDIYQIFLLKKLFKFK